MRRLNLFLCIFYHFPLLLTQRLLYHALSDQQLSRHERAGITACAMLVLYPAAAASTGFQLIMAYRMFLSGDMASGWNRFLFLSVLASLADAAVNPARILLFPWLRMLSGMLIWLGCLTVVLPVFPIVPIVIVAHGGTIMSIAERFAVDETGNRLDYYAWHLGNAQAWIFETTEKSEDDHFLRRTGRIGLGEETGT